jgi:hypothetical protein
VKRSHFVRVALVSLSLSFVPTAVFASLGGTLSSIDADRAHMKSALVRIARSDGYTVHETLSPTGTTVRQYVGADGIVFGVSWDGQFPPDFRQLLGNYFDQYRNAVQTTARARKARGRMAITQAGFVVRTAAHTRFFSGIAYAPNLLPAGVSPSVVR